MDECWEFIELYHDSLRGLVKRTCRGRYDLMEEIWSDVIIARTQECIDTWDGVSSALRTHVFGNLRWYIWKWLNFQCTRMGRETPVGELPKCLPSREDGNLIDLERHEVVQIILDRLPEYERGLLTLYYLEGLSFEEISEVLGTCKSTARTHVMKALAIAQEVAPWDAQ